MLQGQTLHYEALLRLQELQELQETACLLYCFGDQIKNL